MSYGYNAKAVGKGSLAFGYNAFANAFIANDDKHSTDTQPVSNILKTSVLDQNHDITEDQAVKINDYLDNIRRYKEAQNKAVTSSYTQAQKDIDVRETKKDLDASETDVKNINLTNTNNLSLIKGGFLASQDEHEVGKKIAKLVENSTNRDSKGNILSNKFSTKIDSKSDVYMTIIRGKDKDGKDIKDTIRKTQSTGDNAIGIGYYTNASGNSSIAQGSGAYVEADSGIGIGSLSYVDAKAANSIALGVGAQVRKENSIAFGTQSGVYGAGSMGLGPGARVIGDNSVAFGYGSIVKANAAMGLGVGSRIDFGATNSMSIGNNSMVGENATSSIALGEASKVTASSSVALGRAATADFVNSVALGYRSSTFYYGNPNTREASTTTAINDPKDTAHYNKDVTANVHGLDIDPYLPPSVSENIKKKLKDLNRGAAGYISVGGWDASVDENGKPLNNDAKLRGLRRIVNVAPGALDTDAVTVAQLREWTDKSAHFLSLAGAENKSASDYQPIIDPLGMRMNDPDRPGRKKAVDIQSNFNNTGASGDRALALGVYAYANGVRSVALGANSYANSDYGIALGNSARTWSEGYNGNAGIAVGSGSQANYWNAMAMGTGTFVSGYHSLALGAESKVGVIRKVDEMGNVMNVFDANGKSYDVDGDVAYERKVIKNADGSETIQIIKKLQYTKQADNTYRKTAINQVVSEQDETKINDALAIGHGASIMNTRVTYEDKGTDGRTTIKVKEASSQGSIAIGANANVTGSQNSIALGLNSKVEYNDTKAKTPAAFLKDSTTASKYEENNDPGNGVVSVGNSGGVKRRIINVAGGSNDYDAVNVKQLKAVKSYYYSVNSTEATDNKEVNGIAGINSNINNDGATGYNAVAIGSYANATNTNGVALGREVVTQGSNAVGIGYAVTSSASSGVAIGSVTKALGDDSVALGSNAITGYTTTESITNPPAGGPTTRTVVTGATEGVAIGKNATVESKYTVAIGGSAKVVRDSSNNDSESSVAIGASARVEGAKYSVALGLNSKVVNSDTKTTTTAAFTGETNNDPSNGVVSIGSSDGLKRRLINVAGGANDYDAVNVKQLKATAVKYYKTNSTETTNREVNGIAGVSANYNGEGATGTASVTLGSYTKASGNYSTAIGRDVITSGTTAVGIGTNVSAFGDSSVALGNKAITGYTKTEGSTTVPVGALEGVAIGNNATVESKYTVAIGGSAKVLRDTSVATAIKDAESSIAIGASAQVVGAKASVALGLNSKVVNSDTNTKTTGVFLTEENNDPENGVVSIGDTDKNRRIIHVAGGYNDYDAVNVKQLKAAAWGLAIQNAGATTATDVKTKNNKVTLKAGNNVTLATNATDGTVTINASGGLNSITSDNLDVLGVSTTAGAVTLSPKVATTITGTGTDANKLVTSSVVNTAIGNIPITSFKADAGGGTNVAGVFTPSSSKKQVNITGAGSDGTTRETWTQGAARFDSDNIGTHVNSDGRILVGLKNKIAVNEVATYNYASDGTRETTQGPTLSFTGLDMKNKKITNVADGAINATSKDAINGSQLHSKLAEKADKTTVDTLTGKVNANTTNITNLQATVDKAITFKGNDGKGVAKTLGEELSITGEGTVPTSVNTAANNITTKKLADGSGLQIGLADALTNMKSITGKNGFTISSGGTGTGTDIATMTFNPKKTTGGTTTEANISVNNVKLTGLKDATLSDSSTDAVTGKQLEATNTRVTNLTTQVTNNTNNITKLTNTVNANTNLGYKAEGETTTHKVAVGTGLTFKPGTGTVASTAANATTTNAETVKKGIAISTAANGVVNIGLDADTRTAIDNAANKDLSNLSTTGENKVKELAQGAVKVAAGKNVSVTPKAADHVTTYTVDGMDTKVVAGDGVSVSGGDTPDADKVRNYTIGLSADTKAKLDKVANLEKAIGTNGADGRDGKSGTGTDAGMGAKGPTGQDGLNGKDLTTKVNALRNGEAGTVVYTDDQGNRVVKANDGKWYLVDKVNDDGSKKAGATEVTDVQGRLVNPDGTTAPKADDTAEKAMTKLSNIAEGAITSTSNDVVTGRQLHAAKSELAKALGGDSTVNSDGALKAPTYKITNDTSNKKDSVTNVGDAISKLDTRINTVKESAAQPLTFSADTGANAVRKLGSTLAVKGGDNFTPVTTGTGATPAGTNIQVKSDATNGLTVHLADTLTKMKGISGTGTNDLVIKNGDNAVITVKAPTGTDAKGTVDFGGTKLTNLGEGTIGAGSTDAVTGGQLNSKLAEKANATDLNNKVDKTAERHINSGSFNANTGTITLNMVDGNGTSKADENVSVTGIPTKLGYKAGTETVKEVAITTGLTFKAGTGTTGTTGTGTDTETTKTGIEITTGNNGVVNIGLNDATRKAIDNAANKDLGNLSTTGTNKITDLAKTAAKEVVKVGDGINTTVDTDTTTTAGTIIYKVNAYDTHVTGTTDEIEVNAATVGTDKVRNYTLGLSTAIKSKISKIDNLETAIGKNGADGRDGKPGIASGTTAAGVGAQGPTGKDGLNGKDLTTKVNALRNGEAGTVVYTDDQGNRLVKANDGKWYNAKAVDDKGALKPAAQLPEGVTATAVDHPQARLVNPDGTTVAGTDNKAVTKLSNIADGEIVANSHDAVTGGQLFTKLAEKADKSVVDNLTTKVNTNTTDISTLKTNVDKAITFTGDTGANADRKLGETLVVKGGTNFTPVTTGTGITPAGTNIQVKSDATNGLTVHLADTLTGMRGITGTGTSDLVIKNGETKITIAKGTPATGSVAAVPGTVDFNGSSLTNIGAPSAGSDATNKDYVDEAIKKVNNTVAGNATLNFAGNVTKDENNLDTNKVGLALSTGVLKVQGDTAAKDIVTTAKGDTITIGLHKDVKDQLAKLGNTASDGRDGKSGTATGTDAGMGAKGPTGADGLNGKTITEKVNALRNGEAGTVVYTDEAGKRVVRATDGKFYHTDDVDEHGVKKGTATEVTSVQARLVNPNGTTAPDASDVNKKALTKLSNIAEGAITSTSNDAVTGRQLHTAKQELATALGGNAAGDANGTWTPPTYTITKDGATAGTETTDNVGTAITKLDTRINTLKGNPLTFSADTGTAATRKLGETLAVKGGTNFTPVTTGTGATPGVNIQVDSNDANGLTVKLADTLTNMKGISGTGNSDFIIKNGETKITINQGTPATGGGTATPGTVDFGGSKLTNVGEATANDDVTNKKYVDNKVAGLNLGYKAESENGKLVAVTTGLTFKAGTGTTGTSATGTDAMATKTGIAISTEENGVVNIGLDEATRKVIDKAAKLGDTAVDGRDGKAANGNTGAAGNAGDHGPTGKDGLNGTDLTTKVNALRNGEAGTVVYTDKDGNRLVKANDGNYYLVNEVNADGTVKTAADLGRTEEPQAVQNVQARLVNPDGTTTPNASDADKKALTKLSNIAEGTISDKSNDAVTGRQLYDAKKEIGAIIGDTTIDTDGKITGPTFTITKADGTNETTSTIKGAIEKLNTANVDQNAKISKLETNVGKAISFVGDNATTDTIDRHLGETLKIKGQNNISVTKANGSTDTLNVALASDLKNITSITNADADNKPGTKIQLGTNELTITNTQAPATGATKGVTKTVTIGKDGIDAGSMKITNVAKATDDGDATNKKYVDDAISNLNTKVTNNANLRYAGDTNVGAATGEDHLNLALATGTLKVAGTTNQIKTEAKNGTITVSLHETVTNQLDKLGNTAADGRDGKPGVASGSTTAGIGAQGPTGKDGLNGKTVTEKVNALRNGEAGTVVYTDENGERVVRASDGKFYNANEVKADGAVKTKDENGGKDPTEVTTIQARLVNPDGTTAPDASDVNKKALTKLSNIAEGAITATSNDAVTGRQLHTAKSELATALGGNAAVDANGTWTPPTYTITKDGTTAGTDTVNNVGDAVSKLDTRINTLKGNPLTFTGDDNQGVTRTLGETLTVKGGANVDTTATTMTNGVNIRVVKDATSGANGFTVH